MCKVMAVAGIKPDKVKEMWDFAVAITPYMAANDKDGIGYAAQSPSGIFGERWLYPADAWDDKKRHPYSKKEQEIISEYRGALDCEQRYNSFGQFNWGNVHALILHSRLATCGKSITNTHPFVSSDGKTALIHNGIISNTSELTNLSSTCDSECILNEYTKFDVANTPEGIDLVAGKLRGYYACPVLTEDSNGNMYLDIFKDTSAMLTATYIPKLDAMVFCTKPEIIKSVCKDLKWKYRTFFTVEAGQMIRINAVTGAVVGTYAFTPVRYGSTSDYQRRTWGYGWDDDGFDAWDNSHATKSAAHIDRSEPATVTDLRTKNAQIVLNAPRLTNDMKRKALEGMKYTEQEITEMLRSVEPVSKSAEESALVFAEAETNSDDAPTDADLARIEDEEFRMEVEKRLDEALNTDKDKTPDVDADDPTSPFHVKAGS